MDQVRMNNSMQTIPRPPIEHARLEAGFLGRIVGVRDNAMINISGLVCVSLTLSMITFFLLDRSSGLAYAQTVTPIITGIIGFFFGRKFD